MTHKRTIYIDADYILLKSALMAEVVIDWGKGRHTLHSELTDAQKNFETEEARLSRYLGVNRRYDKLVFCFSDETSRYWRHNILGTYKANRLKSLVGSRRPIVYPALRAWANESRTCITHELLEADDVLGINAGPFAVLVSPDKDLRTISCNLFDPLNPSKGIQLITPEEADYNLMSQCLVGDRTDGYPGCPGVGVVGAGKILKDRRSSARWMWEAVVKAYEDKGLTKEDAVINMSVAYILRPGDYEDGTIQLWSENNLKY